MSLAATSKVLGEQGNTYCWESFAGCPQVPAASHRSAPTISSYKTHVSLMIQYQQCFIWESKAQVVPLFLPPCGEISPAGLILSTFERAQGKDWDCMLFAYVKHHDTATDLCLILFADTSHSRSWYVQQVRVLQIISIIKSTKADGPRLWKNVMPSRNVAASGRANKLGPAWDRSCRV